MRVFIAGFQHETNTFAPTKADWSAFTAGSGWLPYMRGPEVLARYRGRAVPISGFIELAEECGWDLRPSVWAGANPSAHVTEDAFERIAGEIAEDLRTALTEPGGVDAVYLDLHGAAVAEHVDDPEGELVARLRAIVGPSIPIVASLDLHANVSARMLAQADAMACYRTYPHIDHFDTGRLAGVLLQRRLARGEREPLHMRRLDFLLSLNMQCTLTEPARGIYEKLLELDETRGTLLSFAMGFSAADVPECGPVIWGYGDAAHEAVEQLFAMADQPRAQWQLELQAPETAVSESLELAEASDGPVIIADTQDNPGAGGDSDTTGMLHALLALRAGARFPGQVVFGLLADGAAATAAHAAGVGATLDLALGRSVPTGTGGFSDPPVEVRARVRSLSDGEVVLTGPMALGGHVSLGPCACLEVEGLLVAVSTQKVQVLDRELLRFLGIDPEAMKILVIKSSVHFRADFGAIASHVLVAKAAGPMAADPADLPWTRLPATMALRP